jgi:hypothetical protein
MFEYLYISLEEGGLRNESISSPSDLNTSIVSPKREK